MTAVMVGTKLKGVCQAVEDAHGVSVGYEIHHDRGFATFTGDFVDNEEAAKVACTLARAVNGITGAYPKVEINDTEVSCIVGVKPPWN